jgi:hypothetical protein
MSLDDDAGKTFGDDAGKTCIHNFFASVQQLFFRRWTQGRSMREKIFLGN